jgi:hypothetical protein
VTLKCLQCSGFYGARRYAIVVTRARRSAIVVIRARHSAIVFIRARRSAIVVNRARRSDCTFEAAVAAKTKVTPLGVQATSPQFGAGLRLNR